MTPPRVALVAPTIADGDAVGHDVLGMAAALEAVGWEAHLFARVADAPRPVRAIEQARDVLTGPDDLLIYHHSIDCAPAVSLVRDVPARIVVRYHSITPPHLLMEEPELARACTRGREQLDNLAGRADCFWATSPFTRRELLDRFPDLVVKVLPPFHQWGCGHSPLISDPSSLTPFASEWRTRILMVGRLAPNKNFPLALAAFAAYRQRFDRRARLILAGPSASERAATEVARLVRELGLGESVTVTGKIPPTELQALFLTSQALLIVSEHEGFGVPLVEAMALRLSIVALARAAVPDTVGPAARLVDRAAPEELAAALWEVIDDARLRERLVEAGWRRYGERFSPEALARRCAALAHKGRCFFLPSPPLRGRGAGGEGKGLEHRKALTPSPSAPRPRSGGEG